MASSPNVVESWILYKDYEVDIVQQVDDASSTFKTAKETKSKKGEHFAQLKDREIT